MVMLCNSYVIYSYDTEVRFMYIGWYFMSISQMFYELRNGSRSHEAGECPAPAHLR